MPKLKKMLCSVDSPYVLSLLELIETQSKETLLDWSIGYAEKQMLPIYYKYYPDDVRLQNAIDGARDWLANKIKLPVAKALILEAHAAAREIDHNPAAQAVARAVGQVAATIHVKRHCIGIATYGSAAIAYDKYGLEQTSEFYDNIAVEVCIDLKSALLATIFKLNQ